MNDKDIFVKGRCKICNGKTSHHHFYCDEHYPVELKAKESLKAKIEIDNETIRRLKQGSKSKNAEMKRLRSENAELRRMYNEALDSLKSALVNLRKSEARWDNLGKRVKKGISAIEKYPAHEKLDGMALARFRFILEVMRELEVSKNE